MRASLVFPDFINPSTIKYLYSLIDKNYTMSPGRCKIFLTKNNRLKDYKKLKKLKDYKKLKD